MEFFPLVQIVISTYLLSGEDVTELFVKSAQESRVAASSDSGNSGNSRKKRDTSDNNVMNAVDDPIKLDETWKPPVRILFHLVVLLIFGGNVADSCLGPARCHILAICV